MRELLYKLERHEDLTLDVCARATRCMLLRELEEATGGEDHAVVAAMRHEATHASESLLAPVVRVQVRSNPSDVYGGTMRHYYLRLNETLEVHPGTPQRLSLTGWNPGTDDPADHLEREALMCRACTDRMLLDVWRRSRRFNIAWNNCDQMLNGTQTKVIALLCFELAAFVAMGSALGAALTLLVAIAVAVVARYRNQGRRYAARVTQFLCRHVDPA